jgi:hypothetical protein
MSLILPNYELLDWIDINKLNWNWLSSNNAIELLKDRDAYFSASAVSVILTLIFCIDNYKVE